MKTIQWHGELPPCDFCLVARGERVPAPYDGPMMGGGPWANMCEEHLKSQGIPEASITSKREIVNG